MSQEKTDSDERMGKYLSEWIEDLQAGNEPNLSQEALHELTTKQISELLAMARFTKALEFPTEPGPGRSDAIKTDSELLAFQVRRDQISACQALVVSANNFGECLRSARSNLEISSDDLSKDCGISRQVLEDVEVGLTSPIRIQPVDKMIALIVSLSIGFRETVALIKETAEVWASENFKDSPTQLGRVNHQLPPSERRRLLNHKDLNDVGSDLEREFERINRYINDLYRSIDFQ